jgi:hypothetical protein
VTASCNSVTGVAICDGRRCVITVASLHKKAIKGKLLHSNITGAGYLVVIQEEGRAVTFTSGDVVFRRQEGASEENTTPMVTQQQHQEHLPDQQYRGTKSPSTEDASEDKEDQGQEPQKEALPPVVNGPQDQPLDYRDPSPHIGESEEEEDSEWKIPCCSDQGHLSGEDHPG